MSPKAVVAEQIPSQSVTVMDEQSKAVESKMSTSSHNSEEYVEEEDSSDEEGFAAPEEKLS
jgi:hypothetical protein